MSEQRMGWRRRSWSKDFDGHERIVVADIDPQGIVQVTEELVVQWLAETGWTEDEKEPPPHV